VISLTVLSPLGVMGIIAKGEKPGEISPPRDLFNKKERIDMFF
jgi:hypothetical protein